MTDFRIWQLLLVVAVVAVVLVVLRRGREQHRPRFDQPTHDAIDLTDEEREDAAEILQMYYFDEDPHDA